MGLSDFGWVNSPSTSTPLDAAELEAFGQHIGSYVDAQDATLVPQSAVGVASGVGTLDAQGRQPAGQLPLAVSQPRINAAAKGGVPCGVSRTLVATYGGHTNGGGNSRTLWQVTSATDAIVVEIPNYEDPGGLNGPIANAITVECSVEYPLGTPRRAFFNGQNQITIDPDGDARTDPVSIGYIAAGTTIAINVFYIPAGGGSVCPLNSTTSTGDTTDTSASSHVMSPSSITSTGFCLAPSQIFAVGSTVTAPAIFLFGDSLAMDQEDTGAASDFAFNGAFARAIQTAGGLYALGKFGMNGDIIDSFTSPGARDRRLSKAAAYSTFVIEQWVNEVMAGSETFEQVITKMLTAAVLPGTQGQRVIVTTCTPRTSSTDGYATTANQTPVTINANCGEPGRQALNNALRNGWPITNTGLPIFGTGTTHGTTSVTSVTGSFVNGQTICGDGFQNGTTIVSGGGTSTLTLNKATTSSISGGFLTAGTILMGHVQPGSVHPVFAVWDWAGQIESTQAGTHGPGGNVWIPDYTNGTGLHFSNDGAAQAATAVDLTLVI